MQKNHASIGEAIRRLRLARKMTQAELAGEAFSKSYISQLERGNVTPSLRALEVIAAKLGVTPSWLLESSEGQIGELLRAASVAYHLGDEEHASHLLAKVEARREELSPPQRWELLLLRIRLAAAREEWPAVLQACRELQQAANEGAELPHRIAIPHLYWWGHAWLSLGNRHQAVRRWEQGLQRIRSWCLEAEALFLMARLGELYEFLGDAQSAHSVRSRLRATVGHLQSPLDLSRWVMARFCEASRFPVLFELGEALFEAEAWARAARALTAAAELRERLEAGAPVTPKRACSSADQSSSPGSGRSGTRARGRG